MFTLVFEKLGHFLAMSAVFIVDAMVFDSLLLFKLISLTLYIFLGLFLLKRFTWPK